MARVIADGEEDELRRTSEFIDAVAASARDRLANFWFPMAAFGVVTIGAAIFAVVIDPAWLGLYWLVAGSVASIATTMHYQRRELEIGLGSEAWPYYAAAAFLASGAFALPFLVADPAWAISIWIGIGYFLFALIERSSVVALVAATFVVLGLVFVNIDVQHETAWLSAIWGLVLLAGAAVISPKELLI